MSVRGLIFDGLRTLLVNIGGWLLGELVREGAFAVAAYMRMYVRKLSARRDASDNKDRRARLAARAQRWLAGARWVREQAWRLRRFVLERLVPDLADVPTYSSHESMSEAA